MTRCVILFSLVGLFVAILAPAALSFRFSNRGKSIFGRGGGGGQIPGVPRLQKLTPEQEAQVPTKQQVDAFLDRNPAAKARVARAQARAASAMPARQGASCGCSSTTCADITYTQIVAFDSGDPCYIEDPKPVVHECTQGSFMATCTDISGCGCSMGQCFNQGQTIVTLSTVCYIGGDNILEAFEDREFQIFYNAGGCCCE